MNINEKYRKLIVARLKNTISANQSNELDLWISESEENKQLYQVFVSTWTITESVNKEVFLIDKAAEWEKLKNDLHFSTSANSVKRKQLYPAWFRIAAAVVLFFSVALLISKQFTNKSTTYSANNVISNVLLPDSSTVSLNANSVIEVSSDFKTKLRKIKLQGEAFFLVQSMPDKRGFVVETQLATVSVKGTRFNVKEFSDTAVNVIVTQGSVAFTANADSANTVLLTSGQSAYYSKQLNKIEVYNTISGNAIAWYTKTLTFNNQQLDSVLNDLESYYGVTFQFSEPNPVHCLLSATFNNQSLQSVLTVIEATISVKFTKKTDKLYVVSGTCQ